jgi:hypothetical protein
MLDSLRSLGSRAGHADAELHRIPRVEVGLRVPPLLHGGSCFSDRKLILRHSVRASEGDCPMHVAG